MNRIILAVLFLIAWGFGLWRVGQLPNELYREYIDNFGTAYGALLIIGLYGIYSRDD